MSPRNPLVGAHFGGAAFDLPGPSNSPGDTQSSSILLPGTVLQKEVVSRTVRQPNDETTILSISQPCTAVDVFVDMRNVPLGFGQFLFRIYAIIGGVRSVVGRGRLDSSAAGFVERRVKWIASARCAASRFEITVARDPLGGGVPPTNAAEFPVSAIGYQATGSHPLAPPLRVEGSWPGVPLATAQISASPGEITSMNGTNAEAAGTAARFLQLWDTLGLAGTGTLLDEIVMKAQDSWSVDYGNLPLLFNLGLQLASSTTTGVFNATPAGLGFFALEIR